MMKVIAVCIVATALAGCASERSLGDPPHFEETLEIVCGHGEMKYCRVTGGNKFKKRYEYCTCVRSY